MNTGRLAERQTQGVSMQISGTRRQWLLFRFDRLRRLYNWIENVYGPYQSAKDGRYRVVLTGFGNRTTKQFSHLKMELLQNRRIHEPETVDHEDGDVTNDRTSNLQILVRKSHAKKDAKHVVPDEVSCVWCGTRFVMSAEQRSIRSKSLAGPFCSRVCTGKYGSHKQNGGNVIRKDRLVRYRVRGKIL